MSNKITGRKLIIAKGGLGWDFYDYKGRNKPMSKPRKKWSKYVRLTIKKDTNNEIKDI